MSKNIFEVAEEIRKQQEGLFSPAILKLMEESRTFQKAFGPQIEIMRGLEWTKDILRTKEQLEMAHGLSWAFQARNGVLSPMQSIFELISSREALLANLSFVERYNEITSRVLPFSNAANLSDLDDSANDFIQVIPQEDDNSISIEVNMDRRIEIASEGEMKIYINEIGKIQSTPSIERQKYPSVLKLPAIA